MKASHSRVPKLKRSLTLDQDVLTAVAKRARNVSEYANSAIKEKLYFDDVAHEMMTLTNAGVPRSEAGVRWLIERAAEVRKKYGIA